MDLLEQVSEQVGFKYVIELVPDNNYGALNLSSGSWNGLVKGMSYVVPGSCQGRARVVQGRSWVVLESCRGSAGVVPGSFLGRAGIVLGLAGSCRVVQGRAGSCLFANICLFAFLFRSEIHLQAMFGYLLNHILQNSWRGLPI